MKQSVSKYASLLYAAVVDARPTEQLSLQEEISMADAYEIQAGCMDKRLERGENISGMKLGFTSKAKMEEMGVHDLIWGTLTNQMALVNGGEMGLRNYINPRVEPEIAFKLGKDIQEIPSAEEVGDYLSGVAVAIEIVDSRYRNFKFNLADVIADNSAASGYVIGDWKAPASKVTDILIAMSNNGEMVATGNSNAILGNPLASLNEAFRLARQYGFSLKKDMIILAGAATPSIYVKEGDQIAVTAEHLGKVSLKAIP